MPLIRTTTGFLALAGAVLASAAPFSGSAPVELVRYLAGGGELIRGLPADFPAFELPEGLRVMGSHDRDNSQRVLLRSQPGGAEAQAAIVEALLAEGWLDLTPEPRQERQYGFIIPGGDDEAAALRPAILCHDELGRLEVRGESGVENRVYLSLFAFSPLAERPSCEEQLASRRAGPSAFIGGAQAPANPYIPRLEAPDTSGVRPFNPIRASIGVVNLMSPGSNAEFETETVIVAGDMSSAELGEHYAGQMREQGWTLDAQWDAEHAAGSNWTRDPQAGPRLFASLQLTAGGNQSYKVSLKMRPLD